MDETTPKPTPNALPAFSYSDERISEVFNRAMTCVQRYDLGHKTMTIGDLLNLEDEIAVLHAYLGEVMAKYNFDYGTAYFNRLVQRASKIQRAIISRDMAVTAAEKTADAMVKDERWAETETSYFAERVLNLTKSLRVILDALGRRITHLRDEYKSVQYHGGSRSDYEPPTPEQIPQF